MSCFSVFVEAFMLTTNRSVSEFEEKQNRLRALRSRQDLFQEEGVLSMILDTIDKFSLMEALPDFTSLIGTEVGQER